MFDHRKSRPYTTALLEAVDEGMFDRDSLIQDLLVYLSEAEVQDFVRKNDLMPWLEDDSEEGEDEDEDEYERRVEAYEAEGMTRSDAQGVVDAEMLEEQK
jgi:hypothetical protein